MCRAWVCVLFACCIRRDLVFACDGPADTKWCRNETRNESVICCVPVRRGIFGVAALLHCVAFV